MINFVPSSPPTNAGAAGVVASFDAAPVALAFGDTPSADATAALVAVAIAQQRLQRLQRERLLAEPERLHPALWRAHSTGLRGRAGVCSGFPALDAELPDGGWPARALTELLLPRAGVGEIRLLAPALGEIARGGRSLMLFDPPAQACAAALLQLGIPVQQCIVVRSLASAGVAAGSDANRGAGAGAGAVPPRRPRSPARPSGADLCWALEQALRSGQVGAVLAWPGRAVRPEALRRLQLAAQAHEGPAFILRDIEAASHPSPAPLRLTLHASGPDEIALSLVKRRGPASAEPLRLTLPQVLSERALGRARANLKEAAHRAEACSGPSPNTSPTTSLSASLNGMRSARPVWPQAGSSLPASTSPSPSPPPASAPRGSARG